MDKLITIHIVKNEEISDCTSIHLSVDEDDELSINVNITSIEVDRYTNEKIFRK